MARGSFELFKKVKITNDKSRVKYHYQRYSYHEFGVLGLVTYDKHGYKHRHTTAQSRKYKQGLFGRAKLHAILFRNLFIVNANYDGNKRNYQKIRRNRRYYGVFNNNIPHINTSRS